MAKDPIINNSVVGSIISLIDWCYKMGVTDAAECDDEGLVHQFIEEVSNVGKFGFLTDRFTIGWLEWALRLSDKARLTAWQGAMTRYFYLAGKFGKNYLSCFFYIAEIWYCKGLKDYTASPGSCDLAVFNSQRRVYWTARGIKKVSSRRYVEEMQLETFSLERRDAAIWENNTPYDAKKMGALKPKHYKTWRIAIGLASNNIY